MASETIRLAAADDVVVARVDLAAGAPLSALGLVTQGAIPAGHKIAARPIAAGAPVRKFDQIIGFATQPIEAGSHVHSHNLEFATFDRDYAPGADARPADRVGPGEAATFEGFHRPDGSVGTRNYVAVIATVNCSANVVKAIAASFGKAELARYANVDGVVAIAHGSGCGISADGETAAVLRRTLKGYALHPNVAGALVVGLGCEANQVGRLKEQIGEKQGHPVRALTIQETGGTAVTIEKGIALVHELLAVATQARRQTASADKLMLALQCGGSDGYSGITANPALGHAVDLLVRQGGTAILSETPEIYGAEHLLTRRAASPAIAERLIERIRWWEAYTAKNQDSMNNNPAPGNKAGGLTTILEKSLGAVAKGGTSALTGVYAYAEPVTAQGFVFMDTPGYDPVSATGQVAGGANVLCFTTGRGSTFGCKPTPSIKLASNSRLYNRMRDDMDINCGTIADGERTIEEVGREIFEAILAVASGRRTKSELLGLGESEFQPWQLGAVL